MHFHFRSLGHRPADYPQASRSHGLLTLQQRPWCRPTSAWWEGGRNMQRCPCHQKKNIAPDRMVLEDGFDVRSLREKRKILSKSASSRSFSFSSCGVGQLRMICCCSSSRIGLFLFQIFFPRIWQLKTPPNQFPMSEAAWFVLYLASCSKGIGVAESTLYLMAPAPVASLELKEVPVILCLTTWHQPVQSFRHLFASMHWNQAWWILSMTCIRHMRWQGHLPKSKIMWWA